MSSELRRLLTSAQFEQLQDAFGGRDLKIPEDPHPTSKIACVIGLEAARLVASIFGGDTVYVPVFDTGERERRDERIYRMRQSGSSYPEIAKRFGLSVRQVINIVNAIKARKAAAAA